MMSLSEQPPVEGQQAEVGTVSGAITLEILSLQHLHSSADDGHQPVVTEIMQLYHRLLQAEHICLLLQALPPELVSAARKLSPARAQPLTQLAVKQDVHHADKQG